MQQQKPSQVQDQPILFCKSPPVLLACFLVSTVNWKYWCFWVEAFCCSLLSVQVGWCSGYCFVLCRYASRYGSAYGPPHDGAHGNAPAPHGWSGPAQVNSPRRIVTVERLCASGLNLWFASQVTACWKWGKWDGCFSTSLKGVCRLFLCCQHTVELDIVDIMTVLGVRYVQMLLLSPSSFLFVVLSVLIMQGMWTKLPCRKWIH